MPYIWLYNIDLNLKWLTTIRHFFLHLLLHYNSPPASRRFLWVNWIHSTIRLCCASDCNLLLVKDANRTDSSLHWKKRYETKETVLHLAFRSWKVELLLICWRFIDKFSFSLHVLHISYYLLMMLINNGYIRNGEKRLFARSFFSDTVPYAICNWEGALISQTIPETRKIQTKLSQSMWAPLWPSFGQH